VALVSAARDERKDRLSWRDETITERRSLAGAAVFVIIRAQPRQGMARRGKAGQAGLGWAWQSEAGKVRQRQLGFGLAGQVLLGQSGQGTAGVVRCVGSSSDAARQGRQGTAEQGWAGLGQAGVARCVNAGSGRAVTE